MKQNFTKTGKLFSFILRRDRIRIPIWIGSLVLITIIVTQTFEQLYATEAEREAIAGTLLNPAMTAMVGKSYGIDNYTTGSMMAHQMLLFTLIAVGIMSIFLVTRHTRADEEDGRAELIQSLPVGRSATLQATILSVVGANILLALLTGFGLYALGMESIDLQGSLLYGSALGAIGVFFAAVTAVSAQISASARGTIGLSMVVLLAAYVVRAIGDVSSDALSWLSPLGWILRTEVYVNNIWWPILLTIGVAIVLFILAFYLNNIRDLEASFIHAKPGKKNANDFLKTPFGLSIRLQRTTLIYWGIGLLILGAVYGSILGDLESFLDDLSIMEDFLPSVEGFTLTEQFLTMLMSVIAILSTIPPLLAVLKLVGEERQNRVEHLLSRALSRSKLMISYIVIALITSFIMQFLSILGLWGAGSAVMDEAITFGSFFNAAMVYLPAMWMMIGIATVLIGWVPRLTSFVWIYLVFSFFVVYLGGLLKLPDWLIALSPYDHIPQLPVDDINLLRLIGLVGIALILIVVGLVGYRKRDIHG